MKLTLVSSISPHSCLRASKLLKLERDYNEKIAKAPWCDLDPAVPPDRPLAFQAAFLGELSTLQEMKEQGLDLHMQLEEEHQSFSLLHLAALGGDLQTFQWLCEQGVNPLIHTRRLDTAFECAVQAQSLEILTHLFTSNVDLHTEDPRYIDLQGIWIEPPYIRGLRDAISYDSYELVALLLQHSPTPEEHYSKVLVCCADAGKLELLIHFRAQGHQLFEKDPLQTVLTRALFGASRNGHLETLKYLLDQEDINEDDLQICLNESAQFDQPEIARYLIQEKNCDLLKLFPGIFENPLFIDDFENALLWAINAKSVGILTLTKELKIDPYQQVWRFNYLSSSLNKYYFYKIHYETYLIKAKGLPYKFYSQPNNSIILERGKEKNSVLDISWASSLLEWSIQFLKKTQDSTAKTEYIDHILHILILRNQHFLLQSFLRKYHPYEPGLYLRSFYHSTHNLKLKCFKITLEEGGKESQKLIKDSFGLFLLINLPLQPRLPMPAIKYQNWPQKAEQLVVTILNQKNSHFQDLDHLNSFYELIPHAEQCTSNLLVHFLQKSTLSIDLYNCPVPVPEDVLPSLLRTSADCNYRIIQRLMALGHTLTQQDYDHLVLMQPSSRYFRVDYTQFTTPQLGHERHQAFLQMLEDCHKNSMMMIRKGRSLLGSPQKLYALTILHGNGYLNLIEPTQQEEEEISKAQRFFQITVQLPEDLQALIANRCRGSLRDVITPNELLDPLKEYLSESSPS
jgi:hypothetical protein